MRPDELIELLAEETDGEAVAYDGLDGAIIGICRRQGSPPVLAYSYELSVDIIMSQMDPEMDAEERYLRAIEWLDFNTTGLYVGPYTPVFVDNTGPNGV